MLLFNYNKCYYLILNSFFNPSGFMRSSIIKYMFCYLVDEIDFDEKRLKKFGYEMGRIMLVLYNFQEEKEIQFLLYKITYSLLPYFYETTRNLEVKNSETGTFLLVENEGLFSKNISLPENETFCCDSIIAGAIEMFLKSASFDSEVTAHNCPSDEQPYRVIYEIKIKNVIKIE
ncbi:hypothetical protein NUSPORA_02396 [Nucleospora cyclopteri]